ncbi:hypothetical protein KAFR_0E04240 [Kazachstania africana CBS 2517]|uniref:FK506-binding protein n=1 Tax=Kazachstania africana (strain ATCC 22294 / BCRC 22015 / CBS 2517 / CECT 1963 / NBRC 1671 / NRRL Y-8276) TaxID=1071382 RepID=H2AW25_KAZAF|nr:hypothetical protein KAFR_0E04240 [Kazachstania africana CBS 2517]CCF58575.1 hypothetical protein KAFR_0E04240 [Kazachstania africana CBS 2517]
MSDMLPLATYSLNVQPYDPTPAIGLDMPVTIRITMAAMDPEPFDDEKKPSTLRMIKRNPNFEDHDQDHEESSEDEESEESEEEEKEPKKKAGKKEESDDDEEEEEEEESDDEEGEDDEFEECVLATLSPSTSFQQVLDITIAPEEEVQFVVTGSYTVSLTGNYVKHPFDTPIEEFGSDSEEEYDDELVQDEYQDEDDEELSDELDDLEDASDIEGRIEELVSKDEAKKNKNKRKQEEQPKEPAQAKKVKKETKKETKSEEPKKEENKKAKKVEFKKDLEEGPTKSQKPKAKVLEGGVIVEDRTVGKGALAKRGSRIGMRYIGKLKNGKVFDKNTSGKPFVFKLGRGEVIKGWDIGVAGMAVGGERRIVIPAPYAYGKSALPGIPANSELTFDVKLVSLK